MDKLKTLTLRVSPEEHRQIKRLSVETGRTVKDLMLECMKRLIRDYEEAQGKQTGPGGARQNH